MAPPLITFGPHLRCRLSLSHRTRIVLLGESLIHYSAGWHKLVTIVLRMIFFSLVACWVYINQGIFEEAERRQRTISNVLQEEERDAER
jgi:hypothetical protein